MKKLSKKVVSYLSETGIPFSVHYNLLHRPVVKLQGFTFVPGSVTTGKTIVIDNQGQRLPINAGGLVETIKTVFPQVVAPVFTMVRRKSYFQSLTQLLST